jgi:hypothetical protein
VAMAEVIYENCQGAKILYQQLLSGKSTGVLTAIEKMELLKQYCSNKNRSKNSLDKKNPAF